METKNLIIRAAELAGLKKCYLTDGKYNSLPGDSICFQASSFNEAFDFAQKHGLSVSLCGRRTGWRDDVCFELATCGCEPVTVAWACDRIFGNSYLYLSPEAIDERINDIIDEMIYEESENERVRLGDVLKKFIEFKGKHLINDNERFWEFESEFIEDGIYHDSYSYFYCVMLD